MEIYLGEHLRPVKREVHVDESISSSATARSVFTKVASYLGADDPEKDPVSFGSSFVKYAEDHSSSTARRLAVELKKVADLLSSGRISAIDRNLRNLFTTSEDDEDLAKAVDVRAELERATGQPEQ